LVVARDARPLRFAPPKIVARIVFACRFRLTDFRSTTATKRDTKFDSALARALSNARGRSLAKRFRSRPQAQGAASGAATSSKNHVVCAGMAALSVISDTELLARMPSLVHKERGAIAEVLEHLIEIDRRRLYLDEACTSLTSYCIERLGYSEDEASKRVRVARLAGRFPELLEELRASAIHLTGLFLLASHLTPENYATLMPGARGKTRKEIEELLAAHFPKPDVPDRLVPVPEQVGVPALSGPGQGGPATCPRTGPAQAPSPGRVEPRSASSFAVQFTASTELRDKIERARELLSHALGTNELAPLFERALDALIERETKRRFGAGKPRKRRALRLGSRHIPVELALAVWERDGNQCTHVDAQGRRCSARRFLTIEHRDPYARGGPPTLDNLCLLCKAHNLASARKVFGEPFIERKRVLAKVHTALRNMGFREREARRALAELEKMDALPEPEPLLRAALAHLT
jgi:HNH endonuclease